MSTDKDTKTIMSPEGYKNIKLELDNLKGETRRDIADEIQKALEFGDLSENAAYTAAIERRDMNETRIAEIEDMLENVEVYDGGNQKNGTVNIGSKVRLLSSGMESEWTLVGASEGDPAQRKISVVTPLGKALLDKKAKDKFTVELPLGAVSYEILSVK